MSNKNVLALGIVLADKEHRAFSIGEAFAGSRDWKVTQKWIAIGSASIPHTSLDVVEYLRSFEPKFVILNRILRQTRLSDYAYVVITDDDIDLPEFFLDRYLEFVTQYDFGLAQPARTHDSYIDHPFVEQLDGITARQTRFVEIGPLFSMRADALEVLTPFDEASPMGWGYDFVWPLVMENAHLTLGIVDATPVGHTMRKPVANYVHADAERQMADYFFNRPHLEKDEAFFIVESYI